MASDTDRTGLTQLPLSAAEVKHRSEQLAHAVRQRDELEAKKASHVKTWNGELATLSSDITRLAEEVELRKAWVPKQTTNEVLLGDEPIAAQA